MASESMNEESLSMFFDTEFNPSNYVDALFQSILNEQQFSNTQLYSKKNLVNLTNKCSNLITHFDYYTNELLKDLNMNLETLKNSNVSISSSEELNNSNDISNNNITRLQYYINILNNSILTLQSDIKTVNNDLNLSSIKQNKAIENFTNLRLVKSNLLKVLKIFETINNISHNEQANHNSSSDSVSLESFRNSINSLHDTIQKQLLGDSNFDQVNYNLINDINELIDLLPLFKNVTNFHLIYKKFTHKLVNDKERYLSMRKEC